MRKLYALVLLAGCTTVVTMEDPCACVVIPEANGALSLALGGDVIAFDGASDGATSDTQGIAGTIWSVTGFGESNGIQLAAVFEGVSLSANWGADPTFDLSAPAPLTEMRIETFAFAGIGDSDAVTYNLGPRGGSLRLREIVPEGEGWRVRGTYSAQVCLTDPAEGACRTAEGSFAFSSASLPDNGAAASLMPGG